MATQQEVARLVIRLQAQTAELQRDLRGAESQISSFASRTRTILATLGATLGIAVAVSQIKKMLSLSVELNSEIQQTKIGYAALIAATQDIYDNQGNLLTGQDAHNASLVIADDLYQKILSKSFMTSATVQELSEGFQTMLAPAGAVNLSLEQTVELALAITQAMKAMRLPMIQMRVEANSLLMGEENIRADIMKRLQIRGDEIKLMREQGKLYDFLMEKLEPFTIAGKEQLNTYEGLKTSIKSVLSLLAARAGEPLFKSISETLKDIFNELVRVDGKTTEFGDNAKEAADRVADSIKGIVSHFKVFREEYGAIIALIEGSLRAIAGAVMVMITGVTAIWSSWLALLVLTGRLIDTLTFGKIPGLSGALDTWEAKLLEVNERLKEQATITNRLIGIEELLWGKRARRPSASAAGGVAGAGVGAGATVSPRGGFSPDELKKADDAIKKLTNKAADLQAQLLTLRDPLAGSRLELRNFIDEAVDGAAKTPELAASISNLRASYESLLAATQKKAILEAIDKSALTQVLVLTETQMEQLKVDYEQGLVDFRTFFGRRKEILDAQAKAEIASLERQRDMEGVTSAQRIEFDAKILAKREEYARKRIGYLSDEREAIGKLIEQIQSANVATLHDDVLLQLAELDAAFKRGLVSVRDYYQEKRDLQAESIRLSILELEAQKELATNQAPEKQRNLQAAIDRLKAQAAREQIGTDEEERQALKDRAAQVFEFNQEILALRREAAQGELDQLLAKHEEELNAIDARNAAELQKLKELAAERVRIGDEFVSKQDAIEILAADQRAARGKILADQEREVWLNKLSLAGTVSQGMEGMFAKLYEASGKKLKAFWYAQKAAAVANAIINTAEGVTKALAQGGILGPVLAGIIQATGAAQVAIILAQSPPKGFVKGGPITGGAGGVDDVPIRATRGEYMQPVPAVRYYGIQAMEAIRRMIVPRELLAGFSGLKVAYPSGGFAEGGMVSGSVDQRSLSVNVGPISVGSDDKRLAGKLKSEIEATVIRVVKDHS